MTDEKNKTTKKEKTRITSRQVVAMAGVILLVFLYVATLILALVDDSASKRFFALSLCGTLVIPVVIFLYSWMYGRITGTKAIGDPEPAESSDESGEARP